MKRYFLYPILGLLLLILLILFTALGILFFRPGLVINPGMLERGLEKSALLDSFSWKTGEIIHEWKGWNDRIVKGRFEDFCIDFKSESLNAQTCLEELSWNFNIIFSLSSGLEVISLEPLKIRSKLLRIATFETEDKEEEEATPPDIKRYWSLLWGKLIPDMDISWDKILITPGTSPELELDLKLIKTAETLNVDVLDFNLAAHPQGFTLSAPPVYKLPLEKKSPIPLELRDFRVVGEMQDQGMPLQVLGGLGPLDIALQSFMDLPLKGPFTSPEFLRAFLLKFSGELKIINIKQALNKYGPENHKTLPAPLTTMNGSIISRLSTRPAENAQEVLLSALTTLDMSGGKQVLQMTAGVSAPFDVEQKSPGEIVVDINFKDVALLLPRVTKTTSPPQFTPDSRISKGPPQDQKKAAPGPAIDLRLKTPDQSLVALKSNLLDEALRMSFDLKVENGELQKGFVKIHPLKTTVFKRPLEVQDMLISFRELVDPVIEGSIYIPLPEYKITMDVEGPVGSPEVAFRSDPPLPQSDIYAVLLFGRPMADLAPEDKNSAQSIDQVLSQGILSLSVLYFLAGSPVEYVGYNPDSSEATAQVGLGSKSSLRVGAGDKGVSTTGVRHSLGKGWYIDTSVKKDQSATRQRGQNYGVLLERIIAY